ncbi:MAG: hypothetical protein MH825_03250 [Cyanobacteria bacterium]|nr:hypothetical protein [Cyanobacteriota bacterium]
MAAPDVPPLPPPFDALTISPGQFQTLTGLDWDTLLGEARRDEHRSPSRRGQWGRGLRDRLGRLGQLGLMVTIWTVGLVLFVAPFAVVGCWLYALVTGQAVLNWGLFMQWTLAIAAVTGLPIAIAGERDEHQKRLSQRSLLPLVRDAVRYNQLVRAVAVQTQLEAVTTPDFSDTPDLQTLAPGTDAIATLQTLRQDIIQALQAERILRENRTALGDDWDQQPHPDGPTLNAGTIGWHARTLRDRARDYHQHLHQEIALGLKAHHTLQPRPPHSPIIHPAPPPE